jgi:hypothetical protein
MTPKEKAFSLYFKFIRDVIADDQKAKQCALIALQEMIELLDELPMNEDVIEQFAYLQEVKQEIQKL